MGGSCVIMFACRALEASWRLSAFPAMIPWYDSYTGGMGDEHRGVGYSYSLGRVGSRLRRALLPPRKLGYAWADRGWGGEVAHTVFPVGPHTSYVLWRSRCVGGIRVPARLGAAARVCETTGRGVAASVA